LCYIGHKIHTRHVLVIDNNVPRVVISLTCLLVCEDCCDTWLLLSDGSHDDSDETNTETTTENTEDDDDNNDDSQADDDDDDDEDENEDYVKEFENGETCHLYFIVPSPSLYCMGHKAML